MGRTGRRIGRPKRKSITYATFSLDTSASLLLKNAGINASQWLSDVIKASLGDSTTLELTAALNRKSEVEAELARLNGRIMILGEQKKKNDVIAAEVRADKFCDVWYLRRLLSQGKRPPTARGLHGGFDIRMSEKSFVAMSRDLQQGKISGDSPIEYFTQFEPYITNPKLREAVKAEMLQELLEAGKVQEAVQQ